MLLFINIEVLEIKYGGMFQYISCYSLSREAIDRATAETTFQYISCYSLSGVWIAFSGATLVSIHLMLLFIYILAIKYTRITRFNTSHVTLYPHGGRNTRNFIQVSIHLMLLFIVKGNSKYQKYDRFNTSHVTLYPTLFASPSMENMFQYISCYSLSQLCHASADIIRWFQYISCYSLSVFIS